MIVVNANAFGINTPLREEAERLASFRCRVFDGERDGRWVSFVIEGNRAKGQNNWPGLVFLHTALEHASEEFRSVVKERGREIWSDELDILIAERQA